MQYCFIGCISVTFTFCPRHCTFYDVHSFHYFPLQFDFLYLYPPSLLLMELTAPPPVSPSRLLPNAPDGASAVSSDEGRVGRVPGSHPGPVSQRQAAAHHQVSGVADRHQGGRPEPGHRQPGAQPGPAGPLPQGAGITHHQPPCQGPHVVSEASAGQT